MFKLSINNNVAHVGLSLKEFKIVTPKAIRTAFYEVGKDLVKDAKRYMDESKSGRTYSTRLGRSKFRKAGIMPNRLRSSKTHIASAPGEAPAHWTGKLGKSIDFKVIGTDRMDFGVDRIRFGCDYAKYLEYKNLIAMTGKTESKKIAPRPFISRSYNENRTKIINRIRLAVQQSLGKK